MLGPLPIDRSKADTHRERNCRAAEGQQTLGIEPTQSCTNQLPETRRPASIERLRVKVANRRFSGTSLSRRRSRVRVPSLPKSTCKSASFVVGLGTNDRRPIFIPRISRTGIPARCRPAPAIPATRGAGHDDRRSFPERMDKWHVCREFCPNRQQHLRHPARIPHQRDAKQQQGPRCGSA